MAGRKKQEKNRRPSSGVAVRLIIMLAVVAAIVFGVAIFFKVTTIEVQGNTLYSAEDVIAASQALGADFLGVGQALAIGGGRRWAAIRDDWPAVWQAVPVRVTVSADVGRTFDLRDGIDTSGGGT